MAPVFGTNENNAINRVVATVGGAGRGRPALTISARHNYKKKWFPPSTKKFFFFFFFLVPGTMFHNQGSIIAQYTYVIYIENDLVRLWIPARALPLDPRSLALRLHWLHSLRLPLLFTIIFHHSDWAGNNPGNQCNQVLTNILLKHDCNQSTTVFFYKLLFSRGFYFREFREPDPSRKFPLLFMSIYSNDNIRKNREINHSRITAPSPKTRK